MLRACRCYEEQLRRAREVRAGSLEHSGKSRQHEQEQNKHGGRTHDGEECGIDRRGEQLGAELVFALELGRESGERAGQVSGSFAGAHEADVEWGEHLGVRGERGGERLAAGDAVADR